MFSLAFPRASSASGRSTRRLERAPSRSSSPSERRLSDGEKDHRRRRLGKVSFIIPYRSAVYTYTANCKESSDGEWGEGPQEEAIMHALYTVDAQGFMISTYISNCPR